MLTSITLGPEHDQELRVTLTQVLEEAGAVRVDHTWRIAGSQEVELWLFHLGIYELTVEAETYVGVSIHGSANLVEQIVAAVRARHPI